MVDAIFHSNTEPTKSIDEEFNGTEPPDLIAFRAQSIANKRHATNCAMCAEKPSRYTCPRCSLKTCSNECCKRHKTEKNCDGVRQKFVPITGYSQFTDNVSIDDQAFLHSINKQISPSQNRNQHLKPPPTKPIPSLFSIKIPETGLDSNGPSELLKLADPQAKEIVESNVESSNRKDSDQEQDDHDDQQHEDTRSQGSGLINGMTGNDRYLLNNAPRRRIWLNLGPNYGSNESRHERFSDTIFWTVDVRFVRKDLSAPAIKKPRQENPSEDGELSAGEAVEPGPESFSIDVDGKDLENEGDGAIQSSQYTVKNIPESLRVCTLLRQFLRPKPQGPVISRGDLDMVKMEPFIRAAPSILHNEKEPSAEHLTGGKLMVYMEVKLGDKLRYYAVDPSQTLLENLRNRFVFGYPKFVVALKTPDEFDELHFPILSADESQELHSERNQAARRRPQQSTSRGRGGNNRQFRGGNNFRQPYQQQNNGHFAQQHNQWRPQRGRGGGYFPGAGAANYQPYESSFSRGGGQQQMQRNQWN